MGPVRPGFELRVVLEKGCSVSSTAAICMPRQRPGEAAVMPVPRPETTPPVRKMYLAQLISSFSNKKGNEDAETVVPKTSLPLRRLLYGMYKYLSIPFFLFPVCRAFWVF